MHHQLLHQAMVEELAHDRERQARRAERVRALAASLDMPREPVTLRLDTVHDGEALARLAALDDRRGRPFGRHVVAEVGGVIVAALPLSGAVPFTDPFRPTKHLLPLLELRASQIAGAKVHRRRGLLRWSRA